MNDDSVLVRVAQPLLEHMVTNDSEPVVILGIELQSDGHYEMVLRRVLEPERVSSNRQGWRARLANVERLLTELDEELVIREQRDIGEPPDYLGERVLEALTEVRSMLDGDTS